MEVCKSDDDKPIFRIMDSIGSIYDGDNTEQAFRKLMIARSIRSRVCPEGIDWIDKATAHFGFHNSTIQSAIEKLPGADKAHDVYTLLDDRHRDPKWELKAGDLVAVRGARSSSDGLSLDAIWIGRVTSACIVPWKSNPKQVVNVRYFYKHQGQFELCDREDALPTGAIIHAQFDDLLVDGKVVKDVFDTLKPFINSVS